MILRTWKGWTRATDADRYHQYLLETGVAACRSTPGNLGVTVARRLVGDRAEFLFCSVWESMEAVKAFAGDQPERAVFFPEDEAFLVERDMHVDHFDILHASGPGRRA